MSHFISVTTGHSFPGVVVAVAVDGIPRRTDGCRSAVHILYRWTFSHVYILFYNLLLMRRYFICCFIIIYESTYMLVCMCVDAVSLSLTHTQTHCHLVTETSVRVHPQYKPVFITRCTASLVNLSFASGCCGPLNAPIERNRFVSAARPHAKKRFVCRFCPQRRRVCSVCTSAAASNFLSSEKYVRSSSRGAEEV